MKLEDFKNVPFRMQDLSAVFPDCVNLPMKATRLEKNGDIIRLRRGLYIVNPKISGEEISPFLISNHIAGPSYVSKHSALRYYGLIPEAVFTVQAMTIGPSREFTTTVGSFIYDHVSSSYYNQGLTIESENASSFIIATPEKALCDLLIYTPNLNLRFQKEIHAFLEDDLRLDMDALRGFNTQIISDCVIFAKKKNMLNQLIKFIENERHI